MIFRNASGREKMVISFTALLPASAIYFYTTEHRMESIRLECNHARVLSTNTNLNHEHPEETIIYYYYY